MTAWLRSKWIWGVALIVSTVLIAGTLVVRRDVVNVMHPALDTLSGIPLSERWSHPAMLRIRELGTQAVPDLRRVLREGNSPKHQAAVAVPILVEALDRAKHQSYYFAQTQPVALAALAEIGPEAAEAVPALESLRDDPNPSITNLAWRALGKIRR